jgi:AcrR family transcriptional regulator
MKPKIQPTQRTSNAEMSAQTRSKILAATVECLAELGYAGTTMSEIAKRIGLTRASLIYHFDSKHALMAAVTNAIYDEMSERYAQAAPPTLSPQERILALFDAAYAMAGSVSQAAMIELLLAARRDPEYGTIVAAEIQRRDYGFKGNWSAIIDELPGKPKRLDVVRDLGVAVLRGMTVSQSIGGIDPTIEQQYAILRHLVANELANDGRQGR